jgi:hypothetical protein
MFPKTNLIYLQQYLICQKMWLFALLSKFESFSKSNIIIFDCFLNLNNLMKTNLIDDMNLKIK